MRVCIRSSFRRSTCGKGLDHDRRRLRSPNMPGRHRERINFLAKCHRGALWGRDCMSNSPYRGQRLGGCRPRILSFGTFWAPCIGACRWRGRQRWWTARAVFQQRVRKRGCGGRERLRWGWWGGMGWVVHLKKFSKFSIGPLNFMKSKSDPN